MEPLWEGWIDGDTERGREGGRAGGREVGRKGERRSTHLEFGDNQPHLL